MAQVLAAGGAPASLVGPVLEALGEGAAAPLRDDPWLLLSVRGVRPEQADGFARALLGPDCRPEDERRAAALVVWLLEQAAATGHTALEADAVREALGRRQVPDPDAALQTAIAEGVVLVFQDAVTAPGAAAPQDAEAETPVRVLLGLERHAMAEEGAADGLARLLTTFSPPPGEQAPSTGAPAPGDGAGADEDTAAAEAPSGAEEREYPPGGTAAGAARGGADAEDVAEPAPVAPALAAWQETAAVLERSPALTARSAGELVRAVAGSGLVVHTGGEAARAEPAAVLAAARALGLRAVGAAHTADGRRRLAEQVDAAARALAEAAGGSAPAPAEGDVVTVPGLLAHAEGPEPDAEGTLPVDVLVVVDAARLDLEAAAQLVESLPDGARLVLSGDPHELGPAGAGRLFGDVAAARCCPVVASRTPDPGPIGELVSGVSVGELNEVAAPGREVVVVPVRDPGEAVHRAVQLVADSVPRALGIPSEETRVITAGHGGPVGTRALNAALKERLNPGPGRFGGFDPGDVVAYAPAVGHTVTGLVRGADAAGLHLDCGASPVVVSQPEVASGALRHGWALTAHQAAGCRWPAVVVVVPGDAAAGLSRDWVYTAFGRGERHLSVVQGGDAAQLAKVVAEVTPGERTTRLRTLLHLQTAAAGAEVHRPR
ncbi:helix-hairpin-helix domain-containing protein [Streptomyces sp. NPDC059740]|uniref:helix-hairpin-helix domain-containing protein n=1 Tax=Streptomyces sp. NPDC059740 TaxID=3346926 RepID=UPI00365EC779